MGNTLQTKAKRKRREIERPQTQKMPGSDYKWLSEFLLDKEALERVLPKLVSEAAEDVIAGGHFRGMGGYVETALGLLASRNNRLIFEYAESPIERIWMNSLHLQFLRSASMLVVTPPVPDFPSHFETVHGVIQRAGEFLRFYLSHGGKLDTLEEYLDGLVVSGHLAEEERPGAYLYAMEYGAFPYKYAHHLTMQATFPSTKRGEKGIRVDGFIWHPTHPTLRVAVECDGYRYHGNAEAFTRDRQRDRRLSSQGISVYRFSGREINTNPAVAVHDLFEYLMRVTSGGPPN